MSKQIITAFGGTLNITSEIEKGTKCIIQIPVKECEQNSFLNQSTTKTFVKSKSTENVLKGKILVVDDEPLIQLAIGTMLTTLGCIVEKASNGRIAYEMVKENNKKAETQYDLIFMDINMPVCNGYEATKLIRKEHIIQVPIICLSAQESSLHQQQCQEAGMTEICINNVALYNIVSKPCSFKEIRRVLLSNNII